MVAYHCHFSKYVVSLLPRKYQLRLRHDFFFWHFFFSARLFFLARLFFFDMTFFFWHDFFFRHDSFFFDPPIPTQYLKEMLSLILNPLRPNNDLSQTSHWNIKGLSVSEVMRIEKKITPVKFY